MKVRRICEWCGKEFYVIPSVVKNSGGNFCSAECVHAAQRKGKSLVCQYCGKEFYAKNRDLRKGKGKFCSDKCARIARRKRKALKCLFCGKIFYAPESGNKKFCSRECYAKWAIGENHHRWKGGEIETTCLQCGKSIRVSQGAFNQGKGKFCSIACFGKWHGERNKGENHPNYEGLTAECLFCGKIFRTYKCHLKKGKGKFCSKACFDKWNRGENNSSWKGGRSYSPYCEKFNNAFKERIRDKFGRTCFICGKTEEENGRKMSVHHVNYSKECLCSDDISCQFVPLCISCHMKTNENRDYWQELIMAKLRSRLDGYYI